MGAADAEQFSQAPNSALSFGTVPAHHRSRAPATALTLALVPHARHIRRVYSTCIFCQRSLGANETLEPFPIGRRIAFDPAKGRLWVVCRVCERWNLTPIEERWEAIENAERLYRGSRRRFSTDNIGLARVGDGLELVRIGAPLRPELAAWRYGDQFGRRRRRYRAYGAATVVVGTAVSVGALAAGLSLGVAVWAARALRAVYQEQRPLVRVQAGNGIMLPVSIEELPNIELVQVDRSGGWGLDIPNRYWERRFLHGGTNAPSTPTVRLTGAVAQQAAARLLPHVNRAGARAADVAEAVRRIETFGTGSAAFRAALGLRDNPRRPVAPPRAITTLPASVRLALEMAAHEDMERRALEGELAELHRAWQEAEEIAAIADDLLVPTRIRQALDRHGRS